MSRISSERCGKVVESTRDEPYVLGLDSYGRCVDGSVRA